MRTLTLVGVMLIMLGVAGLIYEGFTYTQERTVVDLGPLKAKVEEQRRIVIPPAISVVVIAGGVILVFAGLRPRTA